MSTDPKKSWIQSAASSAVTIKKNSPVAKLMAMLCLAHNRPLTNEMLEIYFLALSTELSPERIEELIPIATKGCEFWPSPARLLRLAGVLTTEEQIERDCAGALVEVLDTIAICHASRDDIKRRTMADQVDPDSSMGRILVKIGSGSILGALDMLSQHPRFSHGQEREGMGLELSSIEKLEKRWLQAWREVNCK